MILDLFRQYEIKTRRRSMNRVEYLHGALSFARVRVSTIIEIGVNTGIASQMFLDLFHPNTLHLVDPWLDYPDYSKRGAGKVFNDQEHADKKYDLVVKRFGNRQDVVIHRMTSFKAAKVLPDVDLIFIDGNHHYDYVLKDISLYHRKCRVLAGHDYMWKGPRRAVVESFGDDHVGVDRNRDSVWLTRGLR